VGASLHRAGAQGQSLSEYTSTTRSGPRRRHLALSKAGQSEAALHLVAHIEKAIECIEAFDRSEHGQRIETLAERRLRRYLIWHMQLARAKTVRTLADLDALFSHRLIVELAPVEGYLDSRDDKIVRSVPVDPGLFVVVDRTLIRHPARDGLPLHRVVDAVREFDRRLLGRVCDFVVTESAAALAGWRRGDS
jgi:hypothetical protein